MTTAHMQDHAVELVGGYSTPNRSLNIIRYYPRAWRGDGGITNSVRHISRGMTEAGANVRIAVDDHPAGHDDPFEWVAVEHSGWRRLRHPVGLEAHLRDADLLVLHSAWVFHNVHAASIARRLGVPYVLEPRGAYDPSILQRRRAAKRVWWWTLERKLVREAAAIHIFFDSEREHLQSIGYTGPTITAPNGVSVPETVRWDGGSGGYVLWIGRFDPEHKGLDLLLGAMRLLPEGERPQLLLRGPDWAGGKQRVVDMVQQMGLSNSVDIGQPVYGQKKWDLISQAAAFVYPSRWEGFGNSTAEAVSVGVPTLVTPYPLGRWLAARGAAVMADPTPESLAAGLRKVLSTGETSTESRERIRDDLSWGAVARSWLNQAEALL
jgi:glycosyltransferase involved in cell wall biosynthesis